MRTDRLRILAIPAIALIAACGGKEVKEQGEQPSLGEAQSSTGSARVETEREVTQVQKGTAEIPTIRIEEIKADLNRMDEDDFVAIGFPEDVAENIVAYREDRGNFTSVEQLRAVPGMDLELYDQFKDRLGAAETG